MYVSERHDKLGNLKQRKKAQGDIIVAHSHRVLGVRSLAPFDLRLGLNGEASWGCVAHSVLRGIWDWLWFSCGVARRVEGGG